jgi:hypothetical protein
MGIRLFVPHKCIIAPASALAGGRRRGRANIMGSRINWRGGALSL